MKALDTNILVRFLVKDDEYQAEKVFKLLKAAEDKRDKFFVPTVVVLELLWVLEFVYEISREDILKAIEDLLSLAILEFENREAVIRFLNLAREYRIDLSDLFIASISKEKGCEKTLTFDKKASKCNLFELI